VQTIGFIALLRERGSFGPHLIVAPAEMLKDWQQKFIK
jgi:SNF2 family DNA or RNA helicase